MVPSSTSVHEDYVDIEAKSSTLDLVGGPGMQISVWTATSAEAFKTVMAYDTQAVFADRPHPLRSNQ